MGNKYNLLASPPFHKVPLTMLVNSISTQTYLHQRQTIYPYIKTGWSNPRKRSPILGGKIFSKKVRWPSVVEGACNWIVRVWRRFESNLKKSNHQDIKHSRIMIWDCKRKSPRGDIFSHPPRHFVRIGMPSWNQLLHCWWHRDLNYYSAMVWWTS